MKQILLFLCCISSLHAMEKTVQSNEEDVAINQLIAGFKELKKEDQVIVTTALETMLSFYQKIIKLGLNKDEQWCEMFDELIKESAELKKLEKHYEEATPQVAELLKKHEQGVSKMILSFEKVNERVKEKFFNDNNISGEDWGQFSQEKRQYATTTIIINCKQPLERMANKRLLLATTCLQKTKEIVASEYKTKPVVEPVKTKKKKKKKKSNQSWG